MQRQEDPPSLRALYPGLAENELANADEAFSRYVQVILRIYDRVSGDPKAMEEWRLLTDARLVPYDDGGGSTSAKPNLSIT